jgi:hypothetical protein
MAGMLAAEVNGKGAKKAVAGPAAVSAVPAVALAE